MQRKQRSWISPASGPDNAVYAPARVARHTEHFRRRNAKTPALSGGGFWLREPDDYLLSHGNPHYHRRRVVSRSCSGWEGVGPTRYGHQAKGVVALLRSATNLGRSSNFELCVSHTRIQLVSSCYAGRRYFNRRAASISFAARRSAWDARKC